MARSVERILEEAHLSGYLKLNGRKLKEFPSTEKYDLNDTVFADLSRNRFAEIPTEITKFWCLEHLYLYHNTIKSVPDSLTCLQSLVYLDISHNQLNSLPSSICHLPLEILLVSNNKLQSLPSELGCCKTLTELDISCNQISRLPPQFGLLNLLRCVNIRSNLLLEIPIELTYLKLTTLDISRNRIASLPFELKNMSSLEILRLSDNPLMAPPAVVCARGMIHVFKWLELRNSNKLEKKQTGVQSDNKNIKKNPVDLYKNQPFDPSSIDWSFLNSEFPVQIGSTADERINHLRKVEKRNLDNGTSSPKSTDSLDGSKSISTSADSIHVSGNKLPHQKQIYDNQQNDKAHLQTYREYKESLRLQRTVDSVYKCPSKEISNNVKASIPPEPISEIKSALVDKNPKLVSVKESLVNAEKLNYKSSLTRTKSRNLKDNPFDKLQFTMRREYEKAKEEAELIKQLRATIESGLKVVLPEDLSTALNDGVVLCHFANHVMPHSVASIHVPSPTVPKLTTARSRRNVDNFLDACRKIGVEEKLVCCASDILEARGLAQIAITVAELVHHHNSKIGLQD